MSKKKQTKTYPALLEIAIKKLVTWCRQHPDTPEEEVISQAVIQNACQNRCQGMGIVFIALDSGRLMVDDDGYINAKIEPTRIVTTTSF
jgi:hypothetical protein